MSFDKMDTKLLKSLLEKKSNDPTNIRLESLRLPRDLSLGGTKPKKVFQPNLNAQRTKHRNKDSIQKIETPKKEKPKIQPKKKVLDSKRFVQCQGIFSEGSAQERKTGFFGRPRQESDPSSSLIKPAFNRSDCILQEETEQSMINNMIEMKLNSQDEKLESADTWHYTPEYDNSIKVEDDTVDPYFCKVEEAESNTRIALIKMPESLAGKGLSDDPNVTKLLDYNLGMMTEGKIGTLQVTRSGKIYMKIGKMRYLMEAMHSTGGPETIASYIGTQNEVDKPKFAILGDVEGRFQLIPYWKEL